MHTETDAAQKDRILKSLAIAGLMGLIIFIAWTSIKLVSYVPTAIDSLASLADSIYNYKPPTLVIVANKNIANVDETITISWNIPAQDGTFVFSYTCTDGVALDMRTINGDIQNLTCNTNYNIGNVSSVDIVIHSERNRFTDVPYTIGFIPNTASTPTATKAAVLTVINPSISPVNTTEDSATTTPQDNSDSSANVENESPTPVPEVPITPEPAPKPVPKPAAPTYTQHYIYKVPVSDPNGAIDLSTKLLATGVITSAGTFQNTGVMQIGTQGAIQFEVQNVGTKTSESWTFTAHLPNNTTYVSPVQVALKPNERAILTLGFATPTTHGIKSFGVSVTVSSDIKLANNEFTAVVLIQ